MKVTHEEKDMTALKLTVTPEGQVWYISGSRMPCPSGQDVPTFLQTSLINNVELIRVSGLATNVKLLKELCESCLGGRFGTLEVCSPLCCDNEERKDPELLLLSMRKFNAPAGLGGWHKFTMKDYPSYAIASHYLAGGSDNDYVNRLVDAHPVWPYLLFIDGIDKCACSELIAAILDPRWYLEPFIESSGERLEHYLGLTAYNATKTDSARRQRYLMVLRCWKNNNSQKILKGGPHEFLWRIWASKGGGDKGEAAACRHFINYVRQTWTAAMASTQGHRLFVPRQFFLGQDEIEAYEDHKQKFPACE